MSELREMLTETAERIFEDQMPSARAEIWPDALWTALESAGFDRALMPEPAGGSGLGWADAYELLSVAGRHAAPVPLAEAMIANWLLNRAGIEVDGFVPIAPAIVTDSARLTRSAAGWTLEGSIPRVAWGRASSHVAVVCETSNGPLLVVIARDATGVSMAEEFNLAGEPRDTLLFDGASPRAVAPSPIDSHSLLALAAISRSALIAGAIARILALTVEYANLRVQFGRAIGKFQVIQQNLAVLATEAVASKAASESGSEAIDTWLGGDGEPIVATLACASAKIRAGEAAGRAAAIAHQVFGAIGFTEEHVLHQYTKRLWSWRDEYGSESYWARRLGERVIAAGREALWPTVTDTTVASGLTTTVAQRGGDASA